MANYNVQYRIDFDDDMGSVWRVDLLLKDGPALLEPIQLTYDGTPLILDKQNNDENKFYPIIQTKCTIKYVCRIDETNDPDPELFIVINNDDWLVNIYKDSAIWFKGFIESGGSTSYPWVPRPFAFSMTVVDFSFAKTIKIDLNESGLFKYDYITIGDFINRSLFLSLGYDNAVLNILYSKKPAVIGSDKITQLYVHTDAFYDFEEGPNYVYDALEKFVVSVGARMFHEQGAYWIQFIEDIGTEPQTILQVTPGNLIGEYISVLDTSTVMGNTPGDELVYLDRSQEMGFNKSLKTQQFIYDLKAINKLVNFDWRTDLFAPYDNWQSAPADAGKFIRSGAGGYADPYRIQVLDDALLSGNLQSDPIPVQSGQLIEIHVKNKGFLTLGSPSDEDFTLSTNIIVVLIDIDAPEDLYDMDASGEWVQAPFDPRITFDNKVGKDPSITEIISKPIPNLPGINLGIIIAIVGTTIDKAPPPGSSFYTELYPVFVGVFTTRYVQYVEKVDSNEKYSYIGEDQKMFFLDNQDAGYSNNFFYNDGSDYLPLPAKNWTNDKNIDEIAVKLTADEQAITTRTVTGTFRSNTINFTQSVLLRDKDFIPCMQIRDKYNVKKCTHDMMVIQLLEEGAASTVYTVTPVSSTNKK